MSVIDLEEAKKYLDVIHDDDDDKLQMLLDGAEDEALQFMDRDSFAELCSCDVNSESESSESESELSFIPPSVKLGVLVLLQAAYQASPDDSEKLRAIAERYLFPYRCKLGV